MYWKWFQDWYDHHRTLPILSGLVLKLNKCYLVFALSMNMIWSCLLQYGYSFKLKNNCCSVYMNKNLLWSNTPTKMVCWISIVVTHIFIIAKRCKVNNDSATYLWHCRLGHIGVKRMKKLHVDGLLESLDYESFDSCEPCLMGKMTKTPFSGTMERPMNYWK